MCKVKLLLLLLIGVSLGSKAQDFLRFYPTDSLVRPAVLDSTITITGDSLINDSLTPFTSGVAFKALVNGFSTDTTSGGFSINDTLYTGIPKALSITIPTTGGNGFVIGPNTIVIWPIYNRGLNPTGPVDSLYIYTIVSPALGIADAPLAKMYLFQTTNHLNINFGDAQNLVQQVRIYDILGQSIYSGSADKSKDINTAGWSKAIYLCEITTYAGEKRTIKFRLQ